MIITSQYQENAKHYQEKSEGYQSVHFMELISTVNIQPGWKVLDVGCGTGNYSVLLTEKVGPTGKVIATDPIAERIECAKKFYQRDNIEYHVDSAANIEKYGNDFDLIIANQVIHWIPTQEKQGVFDFLCNALIGGGTFIFLTPHEDSLDHTIKTFKPLGDVGKEMNENYFVETSSTYIQHATQAGFKNPTIEKKRIKTLHTSLEKIYEIIAATFHKVPYHMIMERFKAISQYGDFSHMYDDDGKPMLCYDLSFFKAVK